MTIKLISRFLGNINQPSRLEILLAIGEGEACVCHLEALLEYRQAYISQHLMALRKAGLLETRRDGRYVFYRIQNHQLLTLIQMAGEIINAPSLEIASSGAKPLPKCCCPECIKELNPAILEK